jgi:hypothetical protein
VCRVELKVRSFSRQGPVVAHSLRTGNRTGNARFGVDTGSSLCALRSQIGQLNAPLTVTFCDLVGSTGIASKLDAEDWWTW